MKLEVRRFAPDLAGDFFALHSAPPAECFCAFWWLGPGEDWSKKTAQENRARREALLEAGAYDGYLAYLDGRVAGWCQVGPRDRLPQLVKKFGFAPDGGTWAISCFFVAAGSRRKGVATRLLRHVLAELRAKGVSRVEAYPRRGPGLTDDDLWNGPESMLARAGFRVARDDASRPVLELVL